MEGVNRKKNRLLNLPNVQEIDEMIRTVDKNEDGKISYSEFRVGRSGIHVVLCSPR